MNNKIYLVKEMYDVLSYKFYDGLLNFVENKNTLLIGYRRCGKTTLSVIDALSEGICTDGIRIGFYVDNGTRRIKSTLIENMCENFGLNFSMDTTNSMFHLSNKSTIQLIEKNSIRGHRFDYIVTDVRNITESNFEDIRLASKGNYRIIIGEPNDFFYGHKDIAPEKVSVITYKNLIEEERW